MRIKSSTWSYLAAILLAVMAAAAVLPGCGDDGLDSGNDARVFVP